MKFKAYCVENNIRQSEIAELLGINLANVNQKLNGKQSWTLEQVKILCDYYKLNANEYFL